MKKLIMLVISVTLLLGLIACGNNNNEDENKNPTDELGGITADSLAIIYTDPSIKEIVDTIFFAIDKPMTGSPKVTDDKSEKFEQEIVLGMTSRPISEKAYEKLERIEAEEGDVSYVIYSDGSSIAIAFDDDPSGLNNVAIAAADAFVEKCINTDKTLSYPEGVIMKETFDLVARLKEQAEPEVDKAWNDLASAVGDNGDEFVEAMKQLYTLSTDNLISWFANLYDPAIGGYYYSNSGRDTYSFLPDIESTAQALGFISNSGLIGDSSLKEAIPEWMQIQIVKFIKGLQDPNGFFYHPQWTKELTDSKLSRRARDLNNAVNVLSNFGYRPTYNTPNGDEGDGKLFDGTPVSASLTGRLGSSAVVAVSKVIPTAVAVPSHLENKEAFIKYLDSLNIQKNSYSAGNTLTSQKLQIVQRDKDLAAMGADYSLMDILIDYLNETQFENGLWNEEENYYGINGLMKIGGVYGQAEVLMPRADKAVMAAMRAMTTDQEPGAVTDVYNTWFAVSRTLRHMRDYGTNADKRMADELLLELYDIAPDALRATTEKLAIFKKTDGSFSYTPTYSSENSQGCPVAVPGTVEGDVNATVICTSDILSYIYSALSLSEYRVPQFTYGDWVNYLSILNNLGPVIKDEEEDSKEPVTFDDDDVDGVPDSVSTVIRSAGYIKVSEDPRENATGNVTEISSLSGGSDYIAISCTSPSTANRSCYIFEADICLLSTNSSYPIQIFMEECYMLTLRTSGDKVKIVESTSSSAAKSKDTVLAPSPDVGEWFNIRIEYYPGDMDSVRIKFYYNGTLTAITDGFFDKDGLRASTGKATPSSKFGYSEVYVMKSAECNLMVDNIYCYKENKKYSAYTDTENPLIYNVDEPERVYEIDDTAAGKGLYYNDSKTAGTRYDFSDELSLSELYNQTEGNDPQATLNTLYNDGKLRVKNESNWKGIALKNTADKTLSDQVKYVFECDFTWLDGVQSEDAIASGAAFVGLLGEHSAVDNTYMLSYSTLTLNKDDPDKATLFKYEIDRCKTYNLRIVYISGIGTRVYFDGKLTDCDTAAGKNATDASFEGFGIYLRKGFERPLVFDIDNVYMNTLPLDESDFPSTDWDFVTYYKSSHAGTRYSFAEDITLEVYNKDSSPNGILAAALTPDATASFHTDKLSTLKAQHGTLNFSIKSADWTGFTIANRGNTAGGVGHTYVFEADFCYQGGTLKNNNTDYRIAFVGITSGNENNANMAIYDYITLNDKEGTSLTWHGYTFKKGETYNIRIESVVGGEYRFFVNGEKVASPTTNKTANADANTYAGFGFYFRGRSDNLNITLDNVFIANYAEGEAPESL